uniref:Putative secreted protein n=1 Tax=Anopheles darlingi TaxID=43151 RepID=A0A2M4DC44_ANODA
MAVIAVSASLSRVQANSNNVAATQTKWRRAVNAHHSLRYQIAPHPSFLRCPWVFKLQVQLQTNTRLFLSFARYPDPPGTAALPGARNRVQFSLCLCVCRV